MSVAGRIVSRVGTTILNRWARRKGPRPDGKCCCNLCGCVEPGPPSRCYKMTVRDVRNCPHVTDDVNKVVPLVGVSPFGSLTPDDCVWRDMGCDIDGRSLCDVGYSFGMSKSYGDMAAGIGSRSRVCEFVQPLHKQWFYSRQPWGH